MKQIDEITWMAEEGMTFNRKVDNFIMGNCIQLGINNLTGEIDVIENYEEVEDPNYVPPTENNEDMEF